MTIVQQATDSRRFTPGELVKIRIDRARIEPGEDADRVPVSVGGWRITIDVRTPGVTIERVAPKEWPPQASDVWHDHGDHAWFGRVETDENDNSYPMLVNVQTGRSTYANDVLASYGPMRLAYRDGWTPDAPATVDEPRRVDRRAKLVADLRAAADWIERHTDIPVAGWWHDGISYCAGSAAELERIAAQVGTTVTTDKPSGHLLAVAVVDGVKYRAFHVPAKETPNEPAEVAVGGAS